MSVERGTSAAAQTGGSRAVASRRARMHRVALFTLVLLVTSCAEPKTDTAKVPWDVGMKNELLDRVAADQAARERLVSAMRAGSAPDSATIADLSAVDSANTAWLDD